MNATTTTVQATILGLTRLRNSACGNPRFQVTTTAGVWPTAVDTSCAYSIGNAEYRRSEVVLTLEQGNIIGVTAVPDRETQR